MFCALLMTATVSYAQKPAAAKKPVAKPVAAANPLKSLTDSASYAIGVSVANFYRQQGISKLNAAVVAKAISDVSGNKTLLISDLEANSVMMRCINQAQEQKSRPNVAAGEKFLASNKTKANVKTTATGLQYEVITQGSGARPAAEDTVVCHYRGTLLDGTEFDNSYKRGEPITIPVGGVIKGWTEALQLMPEGSKYKLYIPQQLAYGTPELQQIPAGSLLIFEVELLKVNKGIKN